MPELSTGAVSLHVDGARGGKLTSLRDRRSGRQWLLPPTAPSGQPAGYGASFVDAELSGWDEMAPTIVACRLDQPTGAVSLPDHGELWSVAWETCAADEANITMRGVGRALAYSLERTIRFVDDDRLRLSYLLRSQATRPFPVLWAAHPQFTWRPGCRLELPPHIEQVLDVTSGSVPRAVPWDEGLATRLDHMDEGDGCKVWTQPDQGPAWARLRDPDGGALTLHVDPAQVPYLGIWWDRQAFARVPVVALEPSTGHYDDLTFAVAAGRTPWLPPGGDQRWDVDIEVNAGRHP